ncbi:MAG: SUMF1/EgtB/PvdO family nonheme iron enzyme, partial [Chloroflexota bacterium]
MKRRFLLALISLALPVIVFAQSDPTQEPTTDPTAPAANADWTPVIQPINNLDMALVPVGSFTIGTSKEDADALFADCEQAVGQGQCQYEWFGRETPPSTVTFAQQFWISRTEVTNAQYAECVTAGACTPPSDTTAFADPAYSDYPVVYVTWEQANQYADWF